MRLEILLTILEDGRNVVELVASAGQRGASQPVEGLRLTSGIVSVGKGRRAYPATVQSLAFSCLFAS